MYILICPVKIHSGSVRLASCLSRSNCCRMVDGLNVSKHQQTFYCARHISTMEGFLLFLRLWLGYDDLQNHEIWLFIALHKLGTKAVCVCQILCKLITGKLSTFLKQSLLLAFICVSTLAKNMVKIATKSSRVVYSLAEFLHFFFFILQPLSVQVYKNLPSKWSLAVLVDLVLKIIRLRWYLGIFFLPRCSCINRNHLPM